MSQEGKKITIEIVSSSKTNKKTGVKDDNNDLDYVLHPVKATEKALFGKHVLVNQAYNQAKKILVQTVDTSLNRYFNLSEDYLGENSYKYAKSVITKATSIGTSVGTGIMLGGVAGGAVAATGWLAGEIIAYNNKLSSYYSSLNATNYNTKFSNIRSSLYNNGRGTEN